MGFLFYFYFYFKHSDLTGHLRWLEHLSRKSSSNLRDLQDAPPVPRSSPPGDPAGAQPHQYGHILRTGRGVLLPQHPARSAMVKPAQLRL